MYIKIKVQINSDCNKLMRVQIIEQLNFIEEFEYPKRYSEVIYLFFIFYW